MNSSPKAIQKYSLKDLECVVAQEREMGLCL